MYQYRAKVNRIVDGDSIVLDIDLGFDAWLNNQSVRIYGIDTPESRTRDLDEKSRGLLAKKRVKELLKKGDIITIKTFKDKSGKFGRILAEIETVDGINIGNCLLKEHLAVKYHGQSKLEIEQAHLSNRAILINEGIFIPNES
jgi:micrococcal nuclease